MSTTKSVVNKKGARELRLVVNHEETPLYGGIRQWGLCYCTHFINVKGKEDMLPLVEGLEDLGPYILG